MGGFRKTGVYPINPGAIDDKMLSPCEAFQQQKPMSEQEASEAATDNTLFIAEQQHFQEGYDLRDPEYEAWLKITHPIDAGSEPCSDPSFVSISSNSTSSGKTCSPSSHSVEASSSSSTSDILCEMLVLPQPKQTPKKRRKGLNSKAMCITDSDVLKAQEAAKLEEKEGKERKKLEREEKRKKKQMEVERIGMPRKKRRNNPGQGSSQDQD